MVMMMYNQTGRRERLIPKKGKHSHFYDLRVRKSTICSRLILHCFSLHLGFFLDFFYLNVGLLLLQRKDFVQLQQTRNSISACMYKWTHSGSVPVHHVYLLAVERSSASRNWKSNKGQHRSHVYLVWKIDGKFILLLEPGKHLFT
jgi:hypothetical protein